jgi:hypothetical protein
VIAQKVCIAIGLIAAHDCRPNGFASPALTGFALIELPQTEIVGNLSVFACIVKEG